MGKQVTASERCQRGFGIRKQPDKLSSVQLKRENETVSLLERKSFSPTEPQKNLILRDSRYLQSKTSGQSCKKNDRLS